MLPRISSVISGLLLLPSLAAASVFPRTIPASQCNTGPPLCCNSVQPASSIQVLALLNLLSIVDVVDLNSLVGITCSPISVAGAGGNSCTAQPVCCENNSFNGVVALGCTPINLNV